MSIVHFERVCDEQYYSLKPQILFGKPYVWILINDIGWEFFSYDYAKKVRHFMKKNFSECRVTTVDRPNCYKRIFLSFKNEEDQNFFLLKFSDGIEL